MRFLAKNSYINEINSPKKALAKYDWKVLKTRSNEIRSNEIRSNEIRSNEICIRPELPVVPLDNWMFKAT